MKKKLFYIGFSILSGLILIYSCSKSNTTPAPAGTTASASIQNMVFTPATLNVKTGTTVTWTNMDGMPHTVTELNGVFDSGNLGAGLTYRHTFATAGTFTYQCLVHSTMKTAVVVVTN